MKTCQCGNSVMNGEMCFRCADDPVNVAVKKASQEMANRYFIPALVFAVSGWVVLAVVLFLRK